MKTKAKKITAILLVLVMVFALCACGKKEVQEEPKQEEQTESQVEGITEDEPVDMENKEEDKTTEETEDVESLGSADNITLDTLIGHYEVVHMQGSKNDVSDDDLQLMRSLGLTVTLDIFKDKTAKLTVFDEEIDLTIDVENRVLTMDQQDCAFKFATDELTMYENDSTMVFKKQSNTPGPVPYNQAESYEDMVGKYIEDSDYVNGEILELRSNGDVLLTRDGEELKVKLDMKELIMTVITVDEDGDETETDYNFMYFQQNLLLQLRGDEKSPVITFEPWVQKLADKAKKEAAKAEAEKQDGDEADGDENAEPTGEDGESVAEDGEQDASSTSETKVPYVVVDESEYPDLAEGSIRIRYRNTIGGTITETYEDVDIAGGRLKTHGVTARAESGYTFQHWEDADGNIVSSHSFYQPPITKESTDAMYIAVFFNADGEVES